MKKVTWLAFASTLLLLRFASTAHSNVITFGQRIDVQEMTEVRIDVPAGSVITGLGFRAHQDNITTMLCRYHRVSADGRLVDPKTERAGSEPDHVLEAEILLPDGYVAVGFGARGAPEWDVTTLRVWARKLGPGGRLGKIEVFSAGTAPDSGLEREALPSEADRALTGAGLRFQFNNIAGIYARSCHIANVDSATLKRRLPVVGWIVDKALRNDPAVIAEAHRRSVKKILTSENDVPKNTAIVDASNGQALQPQLPVTRMDEMAAQAADAALLGKAGIVIRATAGATAKPALNQLNLDAAYALAQAPFQNIDEVWRAVTSKRFAEASQDATEALKWIASARALMISGLGQDFLTEDGRMRSYTAMREELEHRSSGKVQTTAAMLLKPTEQTVELVDAEAQTTDWALRIAEQAARRVVDKAPSEESRALTATVQAYVGRAPFWRSVKQAFLYTSLYALDGTDSTKARASSAAAAVLKVSEQGNTPPNARGFANSVTQALSGLTGQDPISVAARQIEKLLSQNRQEQAVEATVSLLSNPLVKPYLMQRIDTISDLASQLKAVYNDPGLRVLRGGDGTWALDKVGGRWALTTSEESRCIYFDVTPMKASGPGDYLFSFDYFDSGDASISLQYDSQYDTDQQYHPAESIQTGNTKTWKRASVRLPNASLAGGQNMLADFRLLGPKPFLVRNFRFERN
ncbi:MAG: hypothetical protein IT209_00300 [Armatimonadetes bacterium]|nr:hypothetical protein [Armatimonadota bacterium]